MTITVSITDDQINTALRTFLIAVCQAPFEAVVGQENVVPEPATPDFAIYTAIRRSRLGTNLDSGADCRFVASISGTTMAVTEVDYGTIKQGATVFGVNVAAGTTVQSGPSGGGAGSYTVTPSQTVAAAVMASGAMDYTAQTEAVVQIDVHGPNSAQNAQVISTLLRDDYGVQLFAQSGFDVTPIHADEPKQIPFINGEKQWEDRYVIEAHLQINPVVEAPQQYAETVTVGLIDVDAKYPP